MTDRYQQIYDRENLRLKQKLAEIDRQTNKIIMKIEIIGVILIFLLACICFY